MKQKLAQRPGRGGITIGLNADGTSKEAVLGFWPEKFDAVSPTSWLGQLP
jgi:hypothetical protein